MRSRHLAALLVASLTCILLSASCVQNPTAAPETDGTAPLAQLVDTKDDDDPAEETSAGDPNLLVQCLALAGAPMPAKEAFCRSLSDPGAAGRCWKNRWSRATWTGWCYFEFGS